MRTSVRIWMILWLGALVCSRAGGEAPATAPSAGDPASTQPAGPVTYFHEQRDQPPMLLHIVTIDLSDPNVSLHVAPSGDDPDGSGPWETTLATVREIAQREQFDLAINGGFFSVRDEREVMGQKVRYFAGNAANFTGVAISGGRIWSDEPGRPLLVVGEDGRARIDLYRLPPEGAREAIAGNVMLLRAGRPLPQRNDQRHPRTAVGVNNDGTRLTILVVDGRREGHSIGMTLYGTGRGFSAPRLLVGDEFGRWGQYDTGHAGRDGGFAGDESPQRRRRSGGGVEYRAGGCQCCWDSAPTTMNAG